jgi:aspartyl-tRNA(Asn)/glutamyl-tRNA(Gln) amidotransferase subunit C
MISAEDIRKLADLARIEVIDEQIEPLRKDMEAVLGYISELEKVGVEGEVLEVAEPYNVLREDSSPHTAGVYTDAILEEAPKTDKGYIRVKKILP